MRHTSQTRSAGKTVVKGVGDSVLRGSTSPVKRGGTERKGTETYDNRHLTYKKLNNADPSPKNY